MIPFQYTRVTTPKDAAGASADPSAMLLAGGTNLVDMMKLDVVTPATLVDVNRVPLTKIEKTATGVRIGALVRMADCAADEMIQKDYRMVSESLILAASPQLRNMASMGGNVMQHTRCSYYRDPSYANCNMRSPGTGCAAIGGQDRIMAVLGTSDQCIASHPSDLCVALSALKATVNVTGPGGERTIPFRDFHVPYGENPSKLTVLKPGEMITSIDVPGGPLASNSYYLKVRERASYAFALASAAVGLAMDGETITDAAVALGGVGTKPWPSPEAEAALKGKPATAETFKAAADAAMKGAKPQTHNGFKVELAKRTLVRALSQVAMSGPMGRIELWQQQHGRGAS